jgi:hypothetical protein
VSNKAENQRRYRAKNKEKVRSLQDEYYELNKQRISDYNKNRLLNESEEQRKIRLERNKAYKKANKDKINQDARNMSDEKKLHRNKVRREHYQKNLSEKREKKRIYEKTLKQKDLKSRVIANIRTRIWHVIKNKTIGSIELTGCPIEQLILYIESKFQSGMNWDNYGKYGWHIDHIIPLSSFNLSNPDELRTACHYTNLQPLWASDNLCKGSKIQISIDSKET